MWPAFDDHSRFNLKGLFETSQYCIFVISCCYKVKPIDNRYFVSQILVYGEDNDISYNHYSDWVSPDDDADGIVDVAYSLDGDASNSDLYPIVDSAGTIPATITNGDEFPLDFVLMAGVGIVAVVLVAVIFSMKRRQVPLKRVRSASVSLKENVSNFGCCFDFCSIWFSFTFYLSAKYPKLFASCF